MGYDFPTHSPDDGLGEMAFEVFVRVMRILDAEYELFMKALYTEEECAGWGGGEEDAGEDCAC